MICAVLPLPKSKKLQNKSSFRAEKNANAARWEPWVSRLNYTVSQKNPCDYVFDDNLNSKPPIVIIFGTVTT